MGRRRTSSLKAFILTFLLSFSTWIVLSGKFDAFHLILGVISSIIVALISSDLLFPEEATENIFSNFIKFIRYIPWLLYQIFLANLHVLYLSLHPRLLEIINPRVVKFRSILTKDLALVTLANSITLTPGTITLSVSRDREFKVHAIDDKSASGLPGQMERRVAEIFGEDNG